MTAFAKPKLYYNNALRDAQTGDDGTPYASCSAAVADASNPFKIIGNISKISDVSALADLVGGIVEFTVTGNKYHITGSGGSNPTAYYNLFERLQDADVGAAFTVHAGLFCNQFDPARPIFFAADGHLSPRAKGVNNTALHILCHAPNFITDGGFESGALSPNWSTDASLSIESASPLEGSKSLKWDTSQLVVIAQSINKKLQKGKTYRVVFKIKSATGSTAADVVEVTAMSLGATTLCTFSGNKFQATTTATWKEFDFTPDFGVDSWLFWITCDSANKGSATAVYIDEIYVYEKRTINAFIVSSHNWGISQQVYFNAWRLPPLRTTASSDANNKTALYNTPFTGNDDFEYDVTVSPFTFTTVYPIIEIILPAVSGWIAEIGEMYLGDSWSLPKYPQPTDPYATGDGYLREMRLQFSNLPPAYRKLNIEDLFERLRQNEAIFVQWDADIPILMEDVDMAKSAPYNPFLVDLTRTFRERL